MDLRGRKVYQQNSEYIESRNWLQQSAGLVKVVLLQLTSFCILITCLLFCQRVAVVRNYKKGHAEWKCVDLAYCTVGFEWVKTFWRSLCYSYCGRLRKFPSVRAKYDRGEQESTISASADRIDHIQTICMLPDPTLTRDNQSSARALAVLSPTLLWPLCVFSFSYVSPSFVYIPVVQAMYLWLFTRVSRYIHLNSSIISSSHLNSRCGSPGEMNCQLLKTSSG